MDFATLVCGPCCKDRPCRTSKEDFTSNDSPKRMPTAFKNADADHETNLRAINMSLHFARLAYPSVRPMITSPKASVAVPSTTPWFSTLTNFQKPSWYEQGLYSSCGKNVSYTTGSKHRQLFSDYALVRVAIFLILKNHQKQQKGH